MKARLSTLTVLAMLMKFASAIAQNEEAPYLRDRGTGLPLSMFGTYITKNEFVVYPFYEYYYDHNAEYKPAELGYSIDQDFLSKSIGHEGLIFLGYGITNRLAIEFEAAVIKETLYKSPEDPSAMPEKLEESGLGDVEGQIRWRWNLESERKPEVFSYFETVLPLQKDKVLIGTQDWEFKLGSGVIKGFNWGTMTVRLAFEYDRSERKTEMGEFAVEYLRRISDFFRFGFFVEGAQDEIEFISDLQFHVNKNIFIRVNNGFGITPKAADYAPEFGVLFHF